MKGGRVLVSKYSVFLGLCLLLISGPAFSGMGTKSVLNNTVLVGEDFDYYIGYDCPTVIPGGTCVNPVITDVLPPEVEYVNAVAARVLTGGINYNGINYDAITHTVTINLEDHKGGDASSVVITVRFPLGTTPDNTTATNTATGTGLGNPTATNPVTVTAIANLEVGLNKTLQTQPSTLDHTTTYRLRTANTGQINVTNATLTDTLPLGDLNANPPVFEGASPAADCQPNCVGTQVATLTWSGLSLNAGTTTDVYVNVRYDSADFSPGVSVTNSYTVDGVPYDAQNPQNFGTDGVTHDVTTFVPAPSVGFGKSIGGPNPPTFNQEYYYSLQPDNSGNIDLYDMVVVDTLPIQFGLHRVTSGAYTHLSDYDSANGIGVQVEYHCATEAANVWRLLGTSAVNVSASLIYDASDPASCEIAVGSYPDQLRWLYGVATPDFSIDSSPQVFGEVLTTDHAGNAVQYGDTITNCGDSSATADDDEDPSTPRTPVNSPQSCASFVLSDDFIEFAPNKTDDTHAAPYSAGDTITWRLNARSHPYSSTGLPLNELVVTDLLPQDLLFVNGSQAISDVDSGINFAANPPTFEAIENYKNTGRTLLRWTWASTVPLPRDSSFDITYNTTVRNGAPLGSLPNGFGMQLNDPNGLGQRCNIPQLDDILDMDEDADTADQRCVMSRSAGIIAVAQLVSSKQVKGTCDVDFVAGTPSDPSQGVLPGGAFQYKIQVQNTGTVPMDNFTLIDILPHIGDTGVIDASTARNSQWSPVLVSPIVAPQGVSVYYSTSDNPCRGEVGGPTSGCDAPNWTTVPPVPISDARSFKLEFTGAPAQPYDTRELIFNVLAPAVLPPGMVANNSFGWRADRTDVPQSLQSEPPLASIGLGSCSGVTLGDYVWIDTDGDGTQNETGTGLNNVQMALYGVGADGVAGTFDDIQLATTLTADDTASAPGWYEFTELSPGTYYVCMDVPVGYSLSPSGQGGDATADSDFDPVNHCSAPVTLNQINDVDLDIDAGLVPTATASLGNYVWFDYNADGLQNEGPLDGVNGVTVELYVDNGDGTADIGSDFLVASQATANDINGLPGYYRFDGLSPGTPYFVRFIKPGASSGFTSADAGSDNSIDSDAHGSSGIGEIVTLLPGQYDDSHDAGLLLDNDGLSLGNQIWFENDNDGQFEPQNGETGINGVRLNLYRDDNGDGLPTTDEYVGSTLTVTANGFDGRYNFGNLGAGDYIVVVDQSNFSGSGVLSGWNACSSGPNTANPNNDINGDNNGYYESALLQSGALALSVGGEPITDGDADADTNLTLDFCFTDAPTNPPVYDYGDDPDALSGTGTGNYNTTQLDSGAAHILHPLGSPYLGECVDADNGALQDDQALADDLAGGTQFGVNCAPGNTDDEDGVAFAASSFQPGEDLGIQITVGSTANCYLYAWIDWNQDGVFDDATEQVISNQIISQSGPWTPGQGNPITVPGNQPPGVVYARFRCFAHQDPGPKSATGIWDGGEVEDYRLNIEGKDWGDLPAAYAITTAANDGAVHTVDPAHPLILGSCVDMESDGQADPAAAADDQNLGNGMIGPCVDDEEGVTFFNGNELPVCVTTDITVIANRAGYLNAWLDLNADNDFDDANEQIFIDQLLNPGVNTLQITVPCDAQIGNTFARFRLSSIQGLPYDGPAPDGEVEDYQVHINGMDFGDAATSYLVTIADLGPRHSVSAAYPLYMGSCVDTENKGQYSTDATGDDGGTGTDTQGTCATGNDDEDGVTFTSAIVACRTALITVNATIGTLNPTARLDAWFDFNQDGDWGEMDEKIFSNHSLSAGNNNLSFTVPCDAKAGNTQLRFRMTSGGVADPTGFASDGEVEDYQVDVLVADFGDAPDSYATLNASNGASHAIDTLGNNLLYLGSCVDSETDGQPVAAANGDDTGAGINVVGACANNDDEDGVSFTNGNELFACQDNAIDVTLSQAGYLDAWIDFNGNGNFADPGEQIASSMALNAGSNTLSVAVPCTAVMNANTYARFRVSSAGGLNSGGPAADGEVEDYQVHINGMDFGDAATSYPVTIADSGARHGVSASTPLYLGSCVDTETNGQESAAADGDDTGAGAQTLGNCTSADDDEDGVSFDSALVACSLASIRVTASQDGILDAWMDFNADGHWDDPGERIFTNQAVYANSNALSINVPCDAVAGNTQLRFRLSSNGVAAPTGAALDGEVEDYQVNVLGRDWGDAPDGYGTTTANSGPSHWVDVLDPLYMGSCIDTEADGQPVAAGNAATGDDTDSGISSAGSNCQAGDDEDGVSFVNGNELFACQSTNVTVVVNKDSILNAWIDFNGDGYFADPGEQIASNVVLNAGSNTLSVAVPCNARSNANTYARFRVSSAGGLNPGGPAADGEVEDYQVHINGVDFGDAATSYPVLSAEDGARHGVSASVANPLYLGSCVDTESNGQESAAADGDDNGAGDRVLGQCASADDDEDGVTFDSPLVTCLATDITVTSSQPGVLDAWIDFNGDGDWNDGNERIFNHQQVAQGANALSFTVPCAATSGYPQLRFRLSSAGVAAPTGPAPDGEVEDYQVKLFAADLGDLPDGYHTTVGANGPMHQLAADSTLYLGSCIDAEPNGIPTANDNGDDLAPSNTLTVGTCTNNDDEDGVLFPPVLVLNQTRDATIVVHGQGVLYAWADFDHNGDFSGPNEVIANGMAVVNGNNTLPITVPANAQLGMLHTRFRLSTNGINSPVGLAPDGEVEDHIIEVVNEADLSLVKTFEQIEDGDASGTLSPGDRVRFTLTMNNAGPADVADVTVEDRLPPGYNAITAISGNGVYDANANTITWSHLALAENGTLVMTFEATVLPFPGAVLPAGFYSNTGEITASDIPDPDSTPGNGDENEDDQSTVTPVVEPIIDLSLVKTFVLSADNDGSGTETWRDVLTFSIQVSNGGPSTATQVAISDVLPLGFDNVANISNGGTYDANTRLLSWNGLILAAGDSVTLTFDAEITLEPDYLNMAQVADALERDLDSDPGNSDDTEDDQSSVEVDVQPVIDLRLEKRALGGPDYHQGSQVDFAVRVYNDAPYDATGVQIIDTLGDGQSNDIFYVSDNGVLGDGQIIWNDLVVPAYGSIELRYGLFILRGGEYVNTVEVMSANEFDLDSVPGNHDGNEDDISVVTLDMLPAEPIPTLSGWALMLLSLMLAMFGYQIQSRREH